MIGDTGHLEHSLDDRGARDDPEHQAVGGAFRLPGEKHAQGGGVEERHRAEIDDEPAEAD